MTMYDVLSGSQRDVLSKLLNEQLARVADKPRENSNYGEESRQGRPRGNRREKFFGA